MSATSLRRTGADGLASRTAASCRSQASPRYGPVGHRCGRSRKGETTNDLFAFLTTEPNAIVAPIHAKAMPVILTTQEEVDLWMTAPGKDALTLQRPLPDNDLRIVARGQKQDGLPDDWRLELAGA